MLKKHRKKFLYALIGGAFVLHPGISSAESAASSAQPAESGESENKEQAGQEFSFQTVTVSSERVKQKAEEEKQPEDYAGGKISRKVNVGILGDTDILDIPFHITGYNAKIIEEKQARTLSDVLLNDPSVRFTTSSGHMNENYTIRGFEVNADDLSFNGLYGLIPSGHVPVEFIDRVEVLKGPGALLYGMPPGGAVGGTVNVVTKKAEKTPVTRVTTDYTSGSQMGIHFDVGRRFGKQDEWGIRINAATRDGQTGVSGQKKEREFGSVNLDYQGKKWRASIDAFDNEEKYKNGSSLMVNFKDTLSSLPDAPDGDINAFKGADGDLKNRGAMFHSEYDFNENLTAYTSLGYLKNTYKGFINSTHARNVDALGNYSGYTTQINGYSDNVSAEAGLRHSFKTGDVTHKMVISATRIETESGSSYKESAKYASNIYHPVVPLLADDPGAAPKTADSTLTSIAVADTLSFGGDKYSLTMGLRNQKIESKNYNRTTGAQTAAYDKSAVTPAIAFVVKPWQNKQISFYANYIEGLSKGSTVSDTTAKNYGEVFAPFKTKQSEIGAKWETGKFVNTISLFQINKPSVLKDDATNTYNEDGKQRNRGIEWTSFGRINDQVSVLGGITYMRGVQTHTQGGANDGNTAYGMPKWQANLGFQYDVPRMEGLSFDTRIIYTGAQYTNNNNTAKIPSWVRLDAGAQYKTKWQGNPMTLRFGVENLTNKNYWSGLFREDYLTIGSGRTYKLSMSVDL